MEFRKHKRKKRALEVSFAGEHAVGRGTLHDLSPVGCGVVSQEKVPVGAFLAVQVHVPGDPESIKVEVAVVRYSLADRFGLDFLQITPAEQARLSKLLRSF